jgi:hypothetical protein
MATAATTAAAQTRALPSLPITIHAEPRHQRVAEKVEKICREEMPRLAAELGLARLEPLEIIVTDDIGPYNDALGGELPRWGVAFAVLEENRILVDVNRATRQFNSLDEVVPHELSHLLVHQRAPDVRFPIWFLEGLAQWQAREWSVVDQWQLMQGVWSRTSPRLADMTWRYPVIEARAQEAYRVSYAGFIELFAEVGLDDLPAFLAAVEDVHSFERGFAIFFGYTTADYAVFFQDDLEKKYGSGFLAFQSGPLLAFAAILFMAVIVRYLIRRRRKFAKLDD